ncbi:MAG: tyrosine-type recombinase/integrase [Anaerolineae bacterium]
MLTLQEAAEKFLDEIAASRSPNTHKAYGQAIQHFLGVLKENGVTSSTPVGELSPEWMGWLIQSLHGFAVATERLYLTALMAFYEHAAAENWAPVNLPALRQLCRRRARREAARLPPFPRVEIEKILDTIAQAATTPPHDEREALRVLRDRALLYVLADTGLRISEACGLTRGHLDWTEARARVLGKGNREAIVRFSERSLRYLRAYLNARAELDGRQGRPLSVLPVFARHDRGAGERVLSLSPRSVEKIVGEWTVAALGKQARGIITPHTFRHYFVTVVLRGSGGNVRLAQELARHRSITTTQRYTHLSDDELDRGYHRIFNEPDEGAEE